MRASKALKAYSVFAEQVEIEYAAMGDIDLAISRAWEYCIKKKLLGEFLQKNRQEVSNMFTEEWNEEYALEAREAKGRREGRMEGEAKEKDNFAKMMLKAKESVAKIVEYTQLPLQRIQELAKSIGVAVVM